MSDPYKIRSRAKPYSEKCHKKFIPNPETKSYDWAENFVEIDRQIISESKFEEH